MFQKGKKGVKESIEEAIHWFLKASSQNHPVAQFALGDIYESAGHRAGGDPRSTDFEEAYLWYSKSAEQGYPAAQYYLGALYEYGRGTAQDVEQAFHWYHKSAVQGYSRAQFMIGKMYEKGCGVKQSYIRALHWYSKPVTHMDALDAMNRLKSKGIVMAACWPMAHEFLPDSLQVSIEEIQYIIREILPRDIRMLIAQETIVVSLGEGIQSDVEVL